MYPVHDVLGKLLDRCIELEASDLHLTSGIEPYFRVNDQFATFGEEPIAPNIVEEIALSLMSTQQQKFFQDKRSIDLAFFSETKTRYRVHAFYQRGSVAIAIRRLDNEFRSYGELNLPDEVGQLAGFLHGLVLVTGPTGSGKSTTLATLLDQINRERACHIITIEDPLEFVHRNQRSLVQQRELHTDVPSFSAAVRAALREDPDVILVGEMRDTATIRAATTAAETGHLVFSTLHTGDAVGTIGRIISVFPAEEQSTVREQLARSLRAVLSQRLIRRKDGTGRVPAMEIMRVNNAVANLIRTDNVQQIYSAMQTGMEDGMVIIEQSLAELVSKDLIDLDDARRMSRDPNILESRLEQFRARLAAV